MTSGDGSHLRPAEDHVRHLLERDGDLGDPAGQALAGPQEEGHPVPAPVVDLQAQGDERLGLAVGRDAFLLAIAGTALPPT